LFVEEGVFVFEACFFILFTLQIGLSKENISV
jgi:hypothetical protein